MTSFVFSISFNRFSISTDPLLGLLFMSLFISSNLPRLIDSGELGGVCVLFDGVLVVLVVPDVTVLDVLVTVVVSVVVVVVVVLVVVVVGLPGMDDLGVKDTSAIGDCLDVTVLVVLVTVVVSVVVVFVVVFVVVVVVGISGMDDFRDDVLSGFGDFGVGSVLVDDDLGVFLFGVEVVSVDDDLGDEDPLVFDSLPRGNFNNGKLIFSFFFLLVVSNGDVGVSDVGV
jgi:hypothetical protein